MPRARHDFIVLQPLPLHLRPPPDHPTSHSPELDAVRASPDRRVDGFGDARAQTLLRESYRPDGFNLGMNSSAARRRAGVAAHVPLHIMPRWAGDANFMSTVWRNARPPRRPPRNLSQNYTDNFKAVTSDK
jgi:ATP adenylyltransferase